MCDPYDVFDMVLNVEKWTTKQYFLLMQRKKNKKHFKPI